MKTTLIVALFSLMSTGLMADMAPDPMTQDWSTLQVRDAKGVPVEMTWEIVDLTPSKNKCDCQVVFGLKNTSDKETSFKVGFPSLNQERLNDFAVRIDGKKVIPEIKKEIVTPEWAKNGGVGRRGNNNFRYWMTWKMTFPANTERKVTITYWTKPTVFWRHNWGPKWRGAVGTVYSDSNVGWRTSGYILRTGASWKNKIGKATIRLHHDHIKNNEIDYRMSGSGWTYNEEKNYSEKIMTNLEPNRNHDIKYFFRISNIEDEFKAMVKAASKPYTKGEKIDRYDLHDYLFNELVQEISKKQGLDEVATKKVRIDLLNKVFVENKAPMGMTNYVGGDSHFRYIKELIGVHKEKGTLEILKPVVRKWTSHLKHVKHRSSNRFLGGEDYKKTIKILDGLMSTLSSIETEKIAN